MIEAKLALAGDVVQLLKQIVRIEFDIFISL